MYFVFCILYLYISYNSYFKGERGEGRKAKGEGGNVLFSTMIRKMFSEAMIIKPTNSRDIESQGIEIDYCRMN